MSAAEQLLTFQRVPDVVLRASIVSSAEGHYAVTFTPANASPIGEHDYLRFALHYYARVLYELVRTDRSVRDLPAILDRIVSGTVAWSGDFFAAAGVSGGAVAAVQQPAGDVAVVLRRAGLRELEIDGEFRLRGRLLARSVLAVLQTTLRRVSPDVATAMFAALANMNVSYTLTHHYRDPRSCREVPAIAYLAASFV